MLDCAGVLYFCISAGDIVAVLLSSYFILLPLLVIVLVMFFFVLFFSSGGWTISIAVAIQFLGGARRV